MSLGCKEITADHNSRFMLISMERAYSYARFDAASHVLGVWDHSSVKLQITMIINKTFDG